MWPEINVTDALRLLAEMSESVIEIFDKILVESVIHILEVIAESVRIYRSSNHWRRFGEHKVIQSGENMV